MTEWKSGLKIKKEISANSESSSAESQEEILSEEVQKADGYITSEAVQTSNRIYSKPYIGASGVCFYLKLKKKKKSLTNSKNKSRKQQKQFSWLCEKQEWGKGTCRSAT